jgi:hypothetical protein
MDLKGVPYVADEEQEHRTPATIEELSASVDHRFDSVDRRFDAVDRRFDAVDRRFDAIDRRFEGRTQARSADRCRLPLRVSI